MPRQTSPGPGSAYAPNEAPLPPAHQPAATPFERFLLWERSSRDTLEVKRTYIDMSGDLVSGIMLSQIVYWHLPDRDGHSRLRVHRDDRLWLAKSRTEWWDECRITPKQADRALQTLRERRLIETRLFRFNGAPTLHIRLNEQAFMQAWTRIVEGRSDESDSPDFPQTSKSISPSGQNPSPPNGENHLPESGKSITETTAETAAETTTTGSAVVASLQDQLIQAGISPGIADELCRTYREQQILQQLAILPYREARDPAAVLVKAIRENWAPPRAYIEAEERRLRNDRLREEAERRRREEAEEQRARETLRAIQDDYWDSLDPHARRQITNEVERRFAEKYPALARMDIVHKSGRIVGLVKDDLRRQILDELRAEG